MPKFSWLLNAENGVAPKCRKRIGLYMVKSDTARQVQIIPVQTLISGLSRGLVQQQGISGLGVKKLEAYVAQVLRVCNGAA